MTRKFFCLFLLATLCVLPSAVAGFAEEKAADLFPDLEGWVKAGDPEIYHADNLWEYINGAADMYLLYDFVKLATLSYDREPKGSITVDVYEHSSLRNAFGVYSREKSPSNVFLKIGAQGYYEKGVLNFFKGSYYVKIMAFYVESGEEEILSSVAEKVAAELDGEERLPEILTCFPEEGKIPQSEAYIARDFMGRSILRSAYIADYEVDGEKKQIFIIEAADEGQARDMMNGYVKTIEAKGGDVTRANGVCRFEDPYFRDSGIMNLRSGGRYLWGMLSDDLAAADFYIEKIEERLRKNRLLG